MHPSAPQLVSQLDASRVLDALVTYRSLILVATITLIALWFAGRVVRGVARAIRRRRPPVIHPNLQKYNVDHAELDRKRHELARDIVATSTGQRLAGFRIVRQVEAVFVEGYRTPEEAVVALKAAAVERGANALLNVATQRTAAGRCTASGDAIVAAALLVRPRASAPSPAPLSPAPPPPAPPLPAPPASDVPPPDAKQP